MNDKAIALGGQDEGAVGLRISSFYVEFFRGLAGNKLNVFN
jgi:hypothetical protein